MEQDFQTPEDVTEFESQMSKNAKTLSPKDKKKLEKAVKEKKSFTTFTMAERYFNAWKCTYNKLPEWRKNEFDIQIRSGTLSDKEWDNDFVRQVVALAEHDDPQAI
jgi:hypothetical protein